MHTDPLDYPYASRRMLSYGHRGMVATSQPLAAQAGMSMLRQGGNAIDAAIATAAALTVVEPTSNGIGSDAFALVWVKGRLHGLNASGPSPRALTPEAVRAAGHDHMPDHGHTPVTVPGAPGAWATLSERFGRLPLAQVLAPAIDLARDGYAASPVISMLWQRAYDEYKAYKSPEVQPWFDHFAPDGHAPEAGTLWRSSDMADTLSAIADSDARAFYSGALADRIEAFSKQHQGYLYKSDLAAFSPEWVDPISISYGDHDIWELPPNGCGLIALEALGILNALKPEASDPAERLHQHIEATKLAYVDGLKHITEPDAMRLTPDDLLSEAYLSQRADSIGGRALDPEPGQPLQGGTVYLATGDSEGNMVSFIQSNFDGFGSGLVVPGTGISLQNRGSSFSLNADDVNALAPGKRPYHTIIPGFITRQQEAIGPFGVMGGHMQPQGHVQVLSSMLSDGLNPQSALDRHRWKWTEGRTIEIEPDFPEDLALALARRGHHIVRTRSRLSFGRGQIIIRDPRTDVMQGATEPRTDGVALPW